MLKFIAKQPTYLSLITVGPCVADWETYELNVNTWCRQCYENAWIMSSRVGYHFRDNEAFSNVNNEPVFLKRTVEWNHTLNSPQGWVRPVRDWNKKQQTSPTNQVKTYVPVPSTIDFFFTHWQEASELFPRQHKIGRGWVPNTYPERPTCLYPKTSCVCSAFPASLERPAETPSFLPYKVTAAPPRRSRPSPAQSTRFRRSPKCAPRRRGSTPDPSSACSGRTTPLAAPRSLSCTPESSAP